MPNITTVSNLCGCAEVLSALNEGETSAREGGMMDTEAAFAELVEPEKLRHAMQEATTVK